MTATHKKLQIMESLDSLDQRQSEKVLDYIKRLMELKEDDFRHERMKHKAMQEIRQAIGHARKLHKSL
jgi:hypothetical protein